MKRVFVFLLLCSFCSGCFFQAVKGIRKNWKVMKNTQSILIGQDINVDKHIYGEPTKTVKLSDGYGLVWGVDRTGEVVGMSGTVRTSGSAWFPGNNNNILGNTAFTSSSGRVASHVVRGSSCYIAIKTNFRGIITKAMNEGFQTDRINSYEPECLAFFTNSRQFCNAVIRANPKQKMGDCWRTDYSALNKPYTNLVIPDTYKSRYVGTEEKHENFFFD